MMLNSQRPYRSYLLRLWQEYHEGKSIWQASLESAQSGETKVCCDLLELVEYLAQQTQIADREYEKEVINHLLKDWQV